MSTTRCFLRFFTSEILGFSGLQQDLAVSVSCPPSEWGPVVTEWDSCVVAFLQGQPVLQKVKGVHLCVVLATATPKPPWRLSLWGQDWEESSACSSHMQGQHGHGPMGESAGMRWGSHGHHNGSDTVLIQQDGIREAPWFSFLTGCPSSGFRNHSYEQWVLNMRFHV